MKTAIFVKDNVYTVYAIENVKGKLCVNKSLSGEGNTFNEAMDNFTKTIQQNEDKSFDEFIGEIISESI